VQAPIGQYAQPVLDPLWNLQPVQFAKQRHDLVEFPRRKHESSGGVQNGLQPVEKISGHSGKDQVAVHHECVYQREQGMSWQ